MKILLSILATAILAISCGDEQNDNHEWPWDDPEKETPEVIEPIESAPINKWTDVSESYGTLSGVKIYRSPEKLQGKKAIAYIAVVDLEQTTWDIWSIADPEMDGTTEKLRTPSNVHSNGEFQVVMNAGFFYSADGKNYSSSLAVRNSEILTYNINYASEDWVTMYYPTRAALLESVDGEFDACWTYKTWDAHYIYPAPSENSWENKPVSQPSSTFPKGGKPFAAYTAIGGGPLLINQGKFVDSYKFELFDGTSGIAPDSNQPRTAVGVTADRKMILFVCEGREMTEGVMGLSTADVANILMDLKCVEAINLDGGGSSCMLVNGKMTIKVSDGAQRAVGSTIMIK
ncbi:MAG: phosphodiester glycosidase family protein [Bacteroidales bacterium]|nr:phosphodiester glycosidase family protein [Bacteroidales bacterium]